MDKLEYIMNNVGGPLLSKTIDTLSIYAKEVPKNGIIVDIGTCEGKSAFILSYYSDPSVKVYTIDPTPNPRVYEHIKELGFSERIEVIEKKSQDINWGISIDLFFNDGLHEYWGIKKDNEIYCPLVVKGGLCMFDDIKLYDNTVGKAILEDEGKYYKRLEIIDNVYIGKKI